MYSIGDIYITTSEEDPSKRFGGEWEKIEGRFLLASSNSYNLGSTGGEATHKLTVAEMPSHTHNEDYYPFRTGGDSNALVVWGTGMISSVHAAGGNQPHNNMPPYIVVNVWKRIA